MKAGICENCKSKLSSRWQVRYCSNTCQADAQYQTYIKLWKAGDKDGVAGLTSKVFSRHIKRYFLEKNNYACSQCGWNKKHPVSGKSPLELDHIDGNSSNNLEKNLRLLCPNCHSLTASFRNYNRGHGRKWRGK